MPNTRLPHMVGALLSVDGADDEVRGKPQISGGVDFYVEY